MTTTAAARRSPLQRAAAFRPSRGFVLRCLAICALATLVVALWRSGLLDPLRPDRLAETRAWARGLYEDAPLLVLGGYILLFGLLTGLGLPVALAMSLLAGAIFGAWMGGTVIVLAATLAALVGYAIAKSVLLGLAPQTARKTPAVTRFLKMVAQAPFMVVLSARLTPILPFNLVNLAAGLASTPLRFYVPATLLGVIPTSFIFATLGSGLGDSVADRTSLLAAAQRPQLIGPVLALALMSVVATVVRLRQSRD